MEDHFNRLGFVKRIARVKPKDILGCSIFAAR